jgi:hypothetical protein
VKFCKLLSVCPLLLLLAGCANVAQQAASGPTLYATSYGTFPPQGPMVIPINLTTNVAGPPVLLPDQPLEMVPNRA